MKYSIIIPYGNARDTIRGCLDSVLVAADKYGAPCEILCINGGSSDSTDFVIDEYVAKDKRIVPYTDWPCCRGGEGPGPARNFGISKAKGDYLVFVDADDFLEPDALVDLKDASADIVTFLSPKGEFDLTVPRERRRLFQPLVGNLLVWNAIYRREMIGDLRFPCFMNYEDLVFTCGAFARAKTVVAGLKPWYRHVTHFLGASGNATWRRVREGFLSRGLMCEALKGAHVGVWTRIVLAKKMTLHVMLHAVGIVPRAALRSTVRFFSFSEEELGCD